MSPGETGERREASNRQKKGAGHPDRRPQSGQTQHLEAERTREIEGLRQQGPELRGVGQGGDVLRKALLLTCGERAYKGQSAGRRTS